MKPLLFFLLFIPLLGHSQKNNTDILDRRISLTVTDNIPNILTRIGKEGGFLFSYSPSILSGNEIITLRVENKTVREALNELFKGGVDYKEKGNHLILTKVVIRQNAQATSFIVSGYVEDALTHRRLVDASVYDKKSVTSVLTDESGYFRMKLDQKDPVAITVSKQNYRDTTVAVSAPGNKYLSILIRPLIPDTVHSAPPPTPADSVKTTSLPLPYESEPNIRNISDTLYRDIQISFLPFLGSNGNLSGNVINNYSINLLGGYSLGTRQIEIGFFVNMDRGDVSFLQVAGLGNLVGGNVYGIQASGFFNVNGGEVKAAQLTGFGNVNLKDFQGVQVAGLANVNLKGGDGVLVAGLANFSKSRSKGVQISGLSNVQIDDYRGSQFSAVSNIATRHLSGSQISAVFNYGKHVRGTQIGLFNFADSLGGVPVGLVSFVSHGYHKLEVSADEVFYANLAFRTGVRQFYNILLAGIKPEIPSSQSQVWTFGYGVGTAPRLVNRLHMNIDLTAQHVNKGSFTDQLSLLSKLHVGLDFQMARKLSLYGGATLNGYFTNTGYGDYPALFTNHQPHVFYSQNIDSNTHLQMWWGVKVGLRFL